MERIILYSPGILFSSVCAEATVTRPEIEEFVNREFPAGTTNGWKISDEAFRGGKPNPCPCDKHADRLHYLLDC